MKKQDRELSYGYRGVIARDFRHSKDGPEIAKRLPSKKPKPKKTYCPKSENGQHNDYEELISFGQITLFRSFRCVNCGGQRG